MTSRNGKTAPTARNSEKAAIKITTNIINNCLFLCKLRYLKNSFIKEIILKSFSLSIFYSIFFSHSIDFI